MDRKDKLVEISKRDAIALVFLPREEDEGEHSYDEFMKNPAAYCDTYPVCAFYDCLPADLIAEYVEGFYDCILSSIEEAIQAIDLDGPIMKNWIGESNDYLMCLDESPAWLETNDILLMVSGSPNGDVWVEQVPKSNPEGNSINSYHFTKADADR